MPGERTREAMLDPGASADTPVRNQGPGRSLPEPDAGHPLQRVGGHKVRPRTRAPRSQVSSANRNHVCKRGDIRGMILLDEPVLSANKAGSGRGGP